MTNDPFVIESVQQLNSRSRNTRGEICNVRFNPLEEQPRPDLTMTTLISRLLDRVLAGRPPPFESRPATTPTSFSQSIYCATTATSTEQSCGISRCNRTFK
uniref:Uncharacterized protein n=1 Tax=Meloidogyne hapla TaxID=6305 RepID=A0A1I8BUA2_MELHA